MNDAKTYRPLYESVRYRAQDGSWHRHFNEAANCSDGPLTWDTAAILSVISFNYACGDRTLLSQIRRQPWMSSIGAGGEPELRPIPPHDTLAGSCDRMVSDFGRLVQEEIVGACRGRKRIYLTLSGGLDSRVVAGLAARAANAGEIDGQLIAVTWGLPDSRDVVYGKAVADILGIEWIYVDYKPEHVLRNVELAPIHIACLVPPTHLHRMPWFEQVPADSLVLAGSYGDMLGRAEFSGKHVLELSHLRPADTYGLLRPEILHGALQSLGSDLKALHDRTPGAPRYVLCEHEMHAFYTRGMLAQVMNLVNDYCDLYQVFTAPRVYSYVWSLHPSLRTDAIYAGVLEKLDPRLARLPWARTNRALAGRTEGAVRGLRSTCHRAREWIVGPLYDKLLHDLDIAWFRESRIFQVENIQRLCEKIRHNTIGSGSYDKFIWLVSLRRFAGQLADMGKTVELDSADILERAAGVGAAQKNRSTSSFRLWLSNSFLHKATRGARIKTRRYRLRRRALKEFPLKVSEEQE